MGQMVLFDDDDDDMQVSWVDSSLKNVYTGLLVDCNREQPFLYNVDVELPDFFERSWLEDDLNLRILKEIDGLVPSPIGLISPEDDSVVLSIKEISSGAKALMMCNMVDGVVLSSTLFGDNCADLLLEVCRYKSVKLVVEHVLHFDEKLFRGYSVTTGRSYTDYREFVLECLRNIP